MKTLLIFTIFCFDILKASELIKNEIFFNVYRNESYIGFHRLNLERKESSVKVNIEISFKVKFLGITVYNYFHQNTEEWYDNKLINLDSSTSKNADKLYCSVYKNKKNVLSVNGSSLKKKKEYIEIIPSSYWNKELIEGKNQKKILNTQDCSIIELNVKKVGQEKIYNHINSNHFKLTGLESSGEKLNIDIWYDFAGNWIKMIFIKDGSKVEYYLDEFDEKR